MSDMTGGGLFDPSKLTEILQSVKQEQANWTPPAPTPETPAKPLLGHWQDWIAVAWLVIIALDYARRQVKWLQFGFSKGMKARVSGAESPSVGVHDENKENKSKTLRRRRNKKKPIDQLKPRAEDSDDKLLKELTKARKGPPTGINMYDIAKLIAVFTMICDHYGYFGIPGISYTTSRWTRVVGRMAAPMFFFLAGYSDKFRFRWHTWCWALCLFLLNAWLGLRLTATVWDSLNSILFINWMWHYVRWEKIQHWAWHIILMVGLCYAKDYFSEEWRIAYGSLPFMIAIAGTLVRRGHYMAKPWCMVCMAHYGYVAINVFSSSNKMSVWIGALVFVDTLIFMFFDKLAAHGEFEFFEKIPSVCKKFLMYFSRNAITVYIVHLMIFRLIQLSKWNW